MKNRVDIDKIQELEEETLPDIICLRCSSAFWFKDLGEYECFCDYSRKLIWGNRKRLSDSCDIESLMKDAINKEREETKRDDTLNTQLKEMDEQKEQKNNRDIQRER